MSRRKTRHIFYRLGTVQNGSLYLFTGLGEFRSHRAAVAKWNASPRNGVAVVVKSTDVGWGLFQEIHTLDGKKVTL